MKLLIPLLLLSGLAIASEPATATDSTCQASVIRMPNPEGIIQAKPIHYELARCEDVKYQGGGVVIRYIVDPLTGKWATIYYPAHRVKSVTVTPKPQ